MLSDQAPVPDDELEHEVRDDAVQATIEEIQEMLAFLYDSEALIKLKEPERKYIESERLSTFRMLLRFYLEHDPLLIGNLEGRKRDRIDRRQATYAKWDRESREKQRASKSKFKVEFK